MLYYYSDQRLSFLLFSVVVCIGNSTQQLSNREASYPQSDKVYQPWSCFPRIWTFKLHLLNWQPGFFWSVVFLIHQEAWFIEDLCLQSWIHHPLVWIEAAFEAELITTMYNTGEWQTRVWKVWSHSTEVKFLNFKKKNNVVLLHMVNVLGI